MKKNSQEITLIDISILGETEPTDCCHICGTEAHNRCSCCKKNICEYCTIEKNNDRKCYLCTSSQERVEIDGMDSNKTICIDFDGVISDYKSGWQGLGVYGKPIPGVDRATKWLKDHGWFIIINTCRDEDEQIAEFCKQNNIWFDSINENPNQPKDGSSKPMADVYLDDKAIGFTGDWGMTLDKIECFKPWWEEPAEEQVIKVFSQKINDSCGDSCDVCGKAIEGTPLKYNNECYHSECLLGKRAQTLLRTANTLNKLENKMKHFTLDFDDRRHIEKQIKDIRAMIMIKKKFDPLFRMAAEDNFSPSANNDSEIEDADDGASEPDPVQKDKKSTTKNYIDRDSDALHQDDPGKPTYPREKNLVHRPRSLNE